MNPWLIRFIHFVTAHAPRTLIAHIMRVRFPPQVSALPKNWCTCHDNVPSLYPGVVVSSKVTAPTPLLVRHWSFCLTTFFVSLSVLSQIPFFSCCLFSVFPRYFFSSFFLRAFTHQLAWTFFIVEFATFTGAGNFYFLFVWVHQQWLEDFTTGSILTRVGNQWTCRRRLGHRWAECPGRIQDHAGNHWFSQCHARSVSGLWLPGHIMDAPL